MSKSPVLSLQHIFRSFHQGKKTVSVLRDATFDLYEGEMVALVGPSGSGKTTFLQIAGLLDSADSGEVQIASTRCTHFNESKRTIIRRNHIGFVYQFHHLLPEFSALENVMLPQIISGISKQEARKNGIEILTYFGLEKRTDHRPGKLSGGEQQRVAIARALVNKPMLLLADEPTGNLDPATSEEVFSILHHATKAMELAVLIVTHNMNLAAKMDRVVTLHEGAIVSDSYNEG